MRNVPRGTGFVCVYTFDELRTDRGKDAARIEIVNRIEADGQFASMLRAIAADWLSNEQWRGLAELRWDDNEDSDDPRLVISIHHRDSDNVVWTATRLMTFRGQEITIETQIAGSYSPTMDVGIRFDDIAGWPSARVSEAVTEAWRIVRRHRSRLVDTLRLVGLDTEADTEYLADYATQQGMEFTADGKLWTE